MKKWFLLGTLTLLMFAACKKDKACASLPPNTVATSAETANLQSYLTSNNITTAGEKNGMFYVISTQGTGQSPNLCSTITIDYVGKTINTTTGTDGAQFDASPANQPLVSSLNKLIAGWQLTMPLVKAGGVITLYIPPSLGYGAQTAGSIPPNSYLKFQITLRDVQ